MLLLALAAANDNLMLIVAWLIAGGATKRACREYVAAGPEQRRLANAHCASQCNRWGASPATKEGRLRVRRGRPMRSEQPGPRDPLYPIGCVPGNAKGAGHEYVTPGPLWGPHHRSRPYVIQFSLLCPALAMQKGPDADTAPGLVDEDEVWRSIASSSVAGSSLGGQCKRSRSQTKRPARVTLQHYTRNRPGSWDHVNTFVC